MAITTGAILSRFESVIVGVAGSVHGGFRPATTRFDFDRAPLGARDGSFRVEALGAPTEFQAFGTGEVVRTMTVAVQVAYYRGGGNSGGLRTGSDRRSVNRRVLNDFLGSDGTPGLIASLEDDDTYDSANTGIRVVRGGSFAKVYDGDLAEIWQMDFFVEWTAEVVTS